MSEATGFEKLAISLLPGAATWHPLRFCVSDKQGESDGVKQDVLPDLAVAQQ